MFRALLALGLTAQAHAMSCATGGNYITGDGHVCPDGSSARVYGNTYRCIAQDWEQTHVSFLNGGCPTGWALFYDGMSAAACKLTVPAEIEDNDVADCSVNMCPDGYRPVEGTCVAPMGLVFQDGVWVPHTCTTISESYINSQCCQGC